MKPYIAEKLKTLCTVLHENSSYIAGEIDPFQEQHKGKNEREWVHSASAT
jgi:hypothetical protein